MVKIMVKGTTSQGKHNKKTHIRCRRCGRHSYNIRKEKCAACGYPRAKIRAEKWRWKTTSRVKRRIMKICHMKSKRINTKTGM